MNWLEVMVQESKNVKLENMKEKEEIILKDPVVQFIKKQWEEAKYCDSLFLTGGAVIDLLEGRKPKDYDFVISGYDVDNIVKKGVELGLTFEYTSATAVTFSWGGYDIQVLRKPVEEFPLTIEQSKFSIKNGNFQIFDAVSFNTKKLIPNDTIIFTRKEITRKNFLNRISKWESKGYSIHPITKRSYLKCTQHKSFFDKIVKFFTSKESKES